MSYTKDIKIRRPGLSLPGASEKPTIMRQYKHFIYFFRFRNIAKEKSKSFYKHYENTQTFTDVKDTCNLSHGDPQGECLQLDEQK